MEALAALGLAANIAQFAVTAGTVVMRTYELALSKKNLQQENEELEAIARDFRLALPAITTITGSATGGKSDDTFKSLGEYAQAISQEIEGLLGTIKAQRAKRRRAAKLFATFKELELFGTLRSLNNRLSNFRDQIGIHINLILLNQQTQIHNALNGHTRANKIYKSEISLKLDDIIKTLELHIVGTSAQDDEVKGSHSWRGTSEDLAALIQAVQSWRPHLLDFHKTERIVTSLEFSQVEERRNAIADAHHQTYQWIFDNDKANLKTWLTVEHAPIYWITGNAGSGKSTLMKFIYKHPSMLDGIGSWAGDRALHVASHFFWLAGTSIQQSQEGLLRSLFYQILLEHPALAQKVFPRRWQAASSLLDRSKAMAWSTKELLDAFLELPRTLGEDCLFIFIDGLDEYSGEHEDLIRIIKSLGTAANVKFCVSSRPWLDFSDAFSASPWKLYLQELTKSDIGIFVRDNLEAHSRFRILSARNREAAKDLVSQITTRAQGVFLWVYLVVRSLVRGLINADTIRDLQRRVDEVPQQLEDFFDRILASIDHFYQSRTAKVFLVLAHAQSSLPLISFYFLDQEEEGLPFEPKTFLQNWPDVNEAELDLITTKKRQLIAQCKDLIDIIELPEEPIMFNFRVLFLHRTVIDFIRQPTVRSRLLEQAGCGFSPVVTLFEINSGQLSSMLHLMNRSFLKPYLCNWLLGSVYYAREIEVVHGISQIHKLRALNAALADYLRIKHEIDSSFSNVLSILRQGRPLGFYFKDFECFARECGLDSHDDVDVRGARTGDARTPRVYIEKAEGFQIDLVTDEMRKNRAGLRVENPDYTNTFDMLTAAEAEAVKLSRLLSGNTHSVAFTPVQLYAQGANEEVPGGKETTTKSRRSRIRKLLFRRE
ncbi:hypothetical protein F4802DRAFT_190772 [Xylaria palmicola]|nr:hypothetical protein F4802DRAFT_190772 [Xylaria palmicola]